MIPGEPYYLGMFLTGAYQDIMGDMHNLFGRVHEVHVFVDDDDPEDYYIEEVIPGDTLERVLTHRTDDQPSPESGFTFVSDLDDAFAQAVAVAGDGDVSVGGGADIIRQGLAQGLVDELVISTAPVILGAGKRLFDGFDKDVDLEITKVYSSPYATHVRYTVTK